MTPADRERIEAAMAQEIAHHMPDDGAAFSRVARTKARTIAANTAQAAHELGRESALGEIETALRELGAEVRTTVCFDGALCAVAITADGQTRVRTGPDLATALLAAIDAVNEMRAAEALARRNVL